VLKNYSGGDPIDLSIRIIGPEDTSLEQILKREHAGRESAAAVVAEVIAAVRSRGDAAVCEYTTRFGGPNLLPEMLQIGSGEIEAAYSMVDGRVLESIRLALRNITEFHKKQLVQSWFKTGEKGAIVGQMVRPLRRVGIYVPGGKASYPSSVLMNAVPARVAGVKEIAMATPPAIDGMVNPCTLVAAAEAGVTEIYRVGGAQAVAALAFGTATLTRVDKITGPGNIYVTLAKQQVYGQVDIDMLAGPSEILIIADGTANPAYAAADLLSQAEHDEMASAVLLTPSRGLAEQVRDEVARQAAALPRAAIMARSLNQYGAIVVTADLADAFDLANRFAPEHLELMVADPFSWLSRVENAGAVFLGHHSPEPVGDYVAGPSHVLPTGGTARFYSPLGVDTFLKKTSLIAYTRDALAGVGEDIVRLAETEGLHAHANSVLVRLENDKREGPM
jgi:histidinol dehydrogenase